MRVDAGGIRVVVIDQAPGVWGAQHYLLRLAPLLREHGVELVLACPNSLELHQIWIRSGYQAFHVDLPVERNIRRTGLGTAYDLVREGARGARAARALAGLVRRERFDAIWANAHWMHAEAAVAGRLTGVPVVVHVHEEVTPGLGRSLRTCAVRTATRAVAVSNALAQAIPAIARDRVETIVNGVDTAAMSPGSPGDHAAARDLRTELGLSDDAVLVVAATRLDPVKRIEDLISAVAMLQDPRVHLAIAGATSAHPDYERAVRARATDLPGQVTFLGARDDVATLFRAADIVLHAGLLEGMPLGLLEAQACGTPVVAYAVAGVPEAVLDGRTGLLAHGGDVDGLSAALRRLSANPELRSEMGTAARSHAVARHSIDVQAMQNARLLAEMCGASAALAR